MTEATDVGSEHHPEEGQISLDLVRRKRASIGLPTPYRAPPPFEHAGTDSVRNFARGIGDVNPFYRDAQYGRASRWGALVGHPTFMVYTGRSEEQNYSPELL